MSLIFGIIQQVTFVPYTVTLTNTGLVEVQIPLGCSKMTIWCWGAGGSGAGIPASTSGRRGGGAGGQCSVKIVNNPLQITMVVQVGKGGVGNFSTGFPGEASYVHYNGNFICIARGGTTANGTSGGIGNITDGIGDLVWAGGNGSGASSTYSGGGGEAASPTGNGNSAQGMEGGYGGDGGNGGDGHLNTNYSNGRSGYFPGGGGSGAIATNPNALPGYYGGNGASGKAVIRFE